MLLRQYGESGALAQQNANIELLRRLSPSTWCTSAGMAKHYVENYDNYILIVNGVTVAGIEAGDVGKNGLRQVNEVTSVDNNGVAPVKYLDDVLAFFEKHGLDKDNRTIKAAERNRDQGVDGSYDPYEYYDDNHPDEMYDHDDPNYAEEYNQAYEDAMIQDAELENEVYEEAAIAENTVSVDDALRHINEISQRSPSLQARSPRIFTHLSP